LFIDGKFQARCLFYNEPRKIFRRRRFGTQLVCEYPRIRFCGAEGVVENAAACVTEPDFNMNGRCVEAVRSANQNACSMDHRLDAAGLLAPVVVLAIACGGAW